VLGVSIRSVPALAALLAAAFLLAGESLAESARSLSLRALERVEVHPHDREAVAEAAVEARRAVSLDATEPRAQLALSLAALGVGYRGGDLFEPGSYAAGSLARSRERVDFALALGPGLSRAQAHAGFLDLLERRFTSASRRLEAARELDRESAHAWCYSAALWLELGRSTALDEALARCGEAARRGAAAEVATALSLRVARRNGDARSEEALHRESVSRTPESPYTHGRYAEFLLRERRYDEAVRHFERAVALEPYPAALRGLEKAELRRGYSGADSAEREAGARPPSPNASALER